MIAGISATSVHHETRSIANSGVVTIRVKSPTIAAASDHCQSGARRMASVRNAAIPIKITTSVINPVLRRERVEALYPRLRLSQTNLGQVDVYVNQPPLTASGAEGEGH